MAATRELGGFEAYALVLYLAAVVGVPGVLLAESLGFVAQIPAGRIATFLLVCLVPWCAIAGEGGE